MKSLTQEISLFFSDQYYRMGELVIDAVIKEGHELKAKVSEHPSESGASFCDHVALEPTTLQIEGIISNTPMTFIGVTAVRSLDNYLHDRSNDLAGEAFKKLEAIFAKREPISITTTLKEYSNMVLESLSVERGGGTSESLHFRATAKQIRMANQATIAISIPEPKPESAKPKNNLGKQETKPASVEKQSLLNAAIEWLKK
jgi:hypothetical protein